MGGKSDGCRSRFYGSTTAMRLAEFDVFEEVVLTDIVEGGRRPGPGHETSAPRSKVLRRR